MIHRKESNGYLNVVSNTWFSQYHQPFRINTKHICKGNLVTRPQCCRHCMHYYQFAWSRKCPELLQRSVFLEQHICFVYKTASQAAQRMNPLNEFYHGRARLFSTSNHNLGTDCSGLKIMFDFRPWSNEQTWTVFSLLKHFIFDGHIWNNQNVTHTARDGIKCNQLRFSSTCRQNDQRMFIDMLLQMRKRFFLQWSQFIHSQHLQRSIKCDFPPSFHRSFAQLKLRLHLRHAALCLYPAPDLLNFGLQKRYIRWYLKWHHSRRRMHNN